MQRCANTPRKVFRIQVLVVGSSVLAGTRAWIARAERLSSQRTTLLPCCSSADLQGGSWEMPSEDSVLLCTVTESRGALASLLMSHPTSGLKSKIRNDRFRPSLLEVHKRGKQSLLQLCEAFLCLERSMTLPSAEETAEFNNYFVRFFAVLPTSCGISPASPGPHCPTHILKSLWYLQTGKIKWQSFTILKFPTLFCISNEFGSAFLLE